MKSVRVTAYDAFGKIYKAIDLEDYPSYYKYPAVVLPDGEVLCMPALVVEPIGPSKERMFLSMDKAKSGFYKVRLLAYDGSLIREWETVGMPAMLERKVSFIPKNKSREVWAFGNYHVMRINGEGN